MSLTVDTKSSPEPETTGLSTAAEPVSNKRIAATGVIPKRMQSWIFLAVVGVGAVGLWFSSSSTKAAKPNSGATGAAADQVKPIVGGLSPEEVQARLKDSEEAGRNATANPHLNLPPSTEAQLKTLAGNLNLTSNDAAGNPQNPGRDSIHEDERKRDYAARFASNIALSYRADTRPAISGNPLPATLPATGSPAEAPALTAAPSMPPALPAEFRQQLEALEAQQQKLLPQQQQPLAAAPPAVQAQVTPATVHHNADLNSATGKNHVIFEGTELESVLVNRLNGDFAGPVICQISTDVYSHDHAELLIPAGSRVLGETKKVNDVGQERLAVVFHRLIMPDGYAVNLDQAPGLNQIGETALNDKVNNHYFRIFGASIAIGALAGLSSIGTNNSAVTGLPTSNLNA